MLLELGDRTRRMLCSPLACALLAFSSITAHAQSYPTKPLRMIVPLPAGSTGDAIARLVAENLRQSIGQSVVVDTRPGASGRIAGQHGVEPRGIFLVDRAIADRVDQASELMLGDGFGHAN